MSIAAIVLILSGPPAESFTKAQTLTAERKFSDAEAVLRAGMKQNPGAQGFHLAIGRVLLAKDEPAEAYFEYFYEVLRAGSDTPRARKPCRRRRTCSRLTAASRWTKRASS